MLTTQLSAQEDRVIRDVVLLNIEPYEVLMNEDGDIIARVRHLPDYLKSTEELKKTRVATEIASREPKRQMGGDVNPSIVKSVSESEAENTQMQTFPENNPDDRATEDFYEVVFAKGTATLSSQAITVLNELAAVLNNDPGKKIQVFGFKNEPAMVASLLAKRRQEACIAYLRIKGVDVDGQVTKGSVTEGVSNKIVFGFE
jgi:outer membrane protein OmpA-like peptidoglycan-associated protein